MKLVMFVSLGNNMTSLKLQENCDLHLRFKKNDENDKTYEKWMSLGVRARGRSILGIEDPHLGLPLHSI